MTTILQSVFSFMSNKKTITAFLLLLSIPFFAQTVTKIFPTRVTETSEVTILGTGFTTTTRDNIRINGLPSLDLISNRVVKNGGTEMTFVIKAHGSDYNYPITINGVSIDPSIDTDLKYVKPTLINVGSHSKRRVREVYTTWDQNGDGEGFWKSSDFIATNNAAGRETWPNDSHDLLGFKMHYNGKDVIFSTGVDDDLLERKLDSLGVDITPTSTEYKGQVFKAYSSKGISGKPHGDNYLAMADKIDGHEGSKVLTDAVRATVYDVIIDGVNGLNMGTGIANFNQNADIRFYSGNGNVGALDDNPDLLITQIAQPGGVNRADVYYYADIDGNVVGRPIKHQMDDHLTNNPRLYQWRLNLWNMNTSNGITYDNSYPISYRSTFNGLENRPFRMAAFKLQDFEINNTNIGDIDNINMGAGGSSDIAFMAYNKAAFTIKSPIIEESPVSRYVCRFPTISPITFKVAGTVENGFSSDPKEEIHYQWYKNHLALDGETGSTFTVPAGLLPADVEGVTYKVRIRNEYGAVDIPFSIRDGGTPTYWYNSAWHDNTGVAINPEDRNLIFTENYDETDYPVTGDLVGCDCNVSAGIDVVIPSGATMTLYNNLTVEPKIPASVDVDNNPIEMVPAGTFTLENNASLVQIKNVATNINSGNIKMKRTVVSPLHTYDYVYWSSPVANFNVSGISNTPTYQWSVNTPNANGQVGDWVAAGNKIMKPGEGYIVRVNSAQVAAQNAGGFTTIFDGKPNNGIINVEVSKSTGAVTLPENRHWNLLGNPYPSALNAERFMTNNTNIEGAIYLWLHNAAVSSAADQPFYDGFSHNFGNQYLTYNGTGSVPAPSPTYSFDGNIASGQGFFVQVLDGAPNTSSVEFNNDMRYDTNEVPHGNSHFYRGSTQEESISETEKQLLWLSLVNENQVSSSTLIGYLDGATNGKDRLYDAYTNNEGLNIYSILSEGKLAIQGLPLPFEDTNTVPLGFNIDESGIYKIAIDNLKGSLFVEQNQDIYIEDTYTNVIHDLRTSPYSFTSEVGEFNDRFILRYTTTTLSVKDVSAANTLAYVTKGMFYVKSSNAIQSVEVFDVNGKKVTNYTINSNAFDTQFSFARGIYIATIKLNNGSVITKKLIN